MGIMHVTGHRQLLPIDGLTPPWPDANPQVAKHHEAIISSLFQFCEHAFKHGIDTFITGMALGADQLFAEAILKLKQHYTLKLIAAVPFHGQEGNWPHKSKEKFKSILSMVDEVKIVSEGPYSPKKMQIRNVWMVDNSDLTLAIWDGGNGGTKNCVMYALSKSKPVMRMDHRKFTYDYIK